MNQHDAQLDQLLNEAPGAPSSPSLRKSIITTALLDLAPCAPASPMLNINIAKAAANLEKNTDIIDFTSHHSQQKSFFKCYAGSAMAGGLMAASLVLGVWAGANGSVDNLIDAPLELAGLQPQSQDDNFNPANIIDGFTPSENL